MKKSEMIEKLQHRAKAFEGHRIDEKFYDDFFEVFLGVCEKAGMLPPERKMTYLEFQTIKAWDANYIRHIHKWEPENESE